GYTRREAVWWPSTGRPRRTRVTQERAAARDVILAVAFNMRSSLEPLVTKTLAPSLYQVYLHAEDYERLRTIFGEIEGEAKALLDRELARMNRDATPVVGRLLRKGKEAAPRFVSAEGRWLVRFQEDPAARGAVRGLSELPPHPAAGYGAGTPTQRIPTPRRLGRTIDRSDRSADPAAAFARIAYKDDSGAKEFWVTKDEVVIGREAPDVWVDLRLETSLDVSREHARLRRVDGGAFRIKDLSKLGTTVNGKVLPPSLEGAGDAERDLDRWVDLPDRSRIGLAGIVFLDFERIAR